MLWTILNQKMSCRFWYAFVITSWDHCLAYCLLVHILQRYILGYRQHSYSMVWHVKIIIISYQWLNVETRKRLSPVRKCREQWRRTAAHRLLKCPGPEFWKSFFQIRFHVLHIIFLNFIWERMNIFLSLHIFLLFPVPVHLDPGDAIPPVAYAPTFFLFLASLVM